jgi:hypothetical protein
MADILKAARAHLDSLPPHLRQRYSAGLITKMAEEIERQRQLLVTQERDILKRSLLELIEKWDARAFTDLDPEPAGKAQSCEVNLPQAASELGNPVRQLTQDGTGNTQKPVAWAVVYPHGEEAIIAFRKADADDMASASDRVVPLYRSPALTDDEREAIKQAIGIVDWHKAYFSRLEKDEPLPSAALRKLLERLQ